MTWLRSRRVAFGSRRAGLALGVPMYMYTVHSYCSGSCMPSVVIAQVTCCTAMTCGALVMKPIEKSVKDAVMCLVFTLLGTSIAVSHGMQEQIIP